MANHETIEIPTDFPGVDPEADDNTVVPTVYQEMVDDNATASMSYTNTVIYHTCTAKPTGISHTITDDLINSDTSSG